MSKECSKATDIFSKRLAEIYIQNVNDVGDKDKLIKAIKEWLMEGKTSDYIDELFSLNKTRSVGSSSSSSSCSSSRKSSLNAEKHFPIWWSGFHIEDPMPETNPIKDMRSASKKINGFSSLDTLMSIALNEQNDFWNKCGKTKNFRWADYISRNYTNIALKSDPENIGLFLNKNLEQFLKTQFFNNEVNLINKHYEGKSRVNLHIFNLNKNCDEIVEKLSEENHNIIFFCYEANCASLTECVKNMKIMHGGKQIHNYSKIKTRKKKRIYKRTRRNKNI